MIVRSSVFAWLLSFLTSFGSSALLPGDLDFQTDMEERSSADPINMERRPVYGRISPTRNYPSLQVPQVWEALDVLRGRKALSAHEIQVLLAVAQPVIDYPAFDTFPSGSSFDCASLNQSGYYADVQTRCQGFYRCDLQGRRTQYLCPNKTVFNQITLVCDWFYNVVCRRSPEFFDYSNSRLYHEEYQWMLFDLPINRPPQFVKLRSLIRFKKTS